MTTALAILEAARAQEAPRSAAAGDAEPHPLLRFVELDGTVRAPLCVVPGFIEEGVVIISGEKGVGKTTTMVPLSLVVAGLHGSDDPLAPKPGRWRHVVYVTEHQEQAQRILAGIVNFGGLGIGWQDVRDRFHLVPAVRLEPGDVVQVADEYRDRFVRNVEGVDLRPLIVFDTKSASFAIEEENSNSEGSKLVAALKQDFNGCSIWVITHVAKANMGRSDVAALSARGAGAQEDDAHGTAFLIREGDERYMVLGKTRFEPKWRELRIRSCWQLAQGVNAWGELEDVTLRWGIAEPAEESRAELRERAQDDARREADTQTRAEILDVVATASAMGAPVNRAALKAKIKRKAADVVAMVDALLVDRWLHEVHIPLNQRVHPNRASFLIRLSESERRTVLAGRGLPAERVAVPPSWRRPAALPPSIPGGNG